MTTDNHDGAKIAVSPDSNNIAVKLIAATENQLRTDEAVLGMHRAYEITNSAGDVFHVKTPAAAAKYQSLPGYDVVPLDAAPTIEIDPRFSAAHYEHDLKIDPLLRAMQDDGLVAIVPQVVQAPIAQDTQDAQNAAYKTIDVLRAHLSEDAGIRAETDLRNRGMALCDTRGKLWDAICAPVAAPIVATVPSEQNPWRDLLAGLLDIWEDSKLDYESRCYVPNAIDTTFDEVRALLATDKEAL